MRETQLSILDAIQSAKSRDEGIARAVDHADREVENWSEMAYELLREFAQESTSSFMAEEVRSYAAMKDFPLPPSARAWGHVFTRAKGKIIVKIGLQSVSNVKAHRANAGVWRKL